MNDPRIEAIVRKKVDFWREAASFGTKPKDTSNPIHAQQIGWSQCAEELESLIPALSEVVRQAHTDGANWMLDNIRGSLRGYPNQGGDIEVMTEVERLIRQTHAEAIEAAATVVPEQVWEFLSHFAIYAPKASEIESFIESSIRAVTPTLAGEGERDNKTGEVF